MTPGLAGPAGLAAALTCWLLLALLRPSPPGWRRRLGVVRQRAGSPGPGGDPRPDRPQPHGRDHCLPLPADLVLELVAGLLESGAPVRQAVDLVRVTVNPAATDLADVVQLSESTGLPPAALLRARADDLRRSRDAAHARAVRRLAVLLVLPMGLCLLPAFVLLAVAPLVLDLLVGR